MLRFASRLPDPLIRLPPLGFRTLGLRLDQRPERSWQALTAARLQEHGVKRGPEDIVLALIEGSVPDPDGLSSHVPRQLRDQNLGQIAAPVDPVHDLQGAVIVALEVGDELHELVRLPVETQEVQRLEGERRVPDPRVPVVPIALTTRRLW